LSERARAGGGGRRSPLALDGMSSEPVPGCAA
jgi:hypothetical protein